MVSPLSEPDMVIFPPQGLYGRLLIYSLPLECLFEFSFDFSFKSCYRLSMLKMIIDFKMHNCQ